jgi:hypothetical protein
MIFLRDKEALICFEAAATLMESEDATLGEVEQNGYRKRCVCQVLMEENYRSYFLHFVKAAGLESSLKSTDGISVERIIEENYHLFDSEVMKFLISSALQERDENLKNGKSESELLGSWGVIIDLFKSITIKKREKASELMQRLCQVGYQEGPNGLEKLISLFRRGKLIDSVLVDLVSSSYDDCQRMQGGGKEIVQILSYLNSAFEPEKQYFLRSLAQSKDSSSSTGPSSSAVPASSSSSIALPAPPSITQPREEEEEFNQSELLAAGEFLQRTLDTCKGDAKKLKAAILHNLRSFHSLTLVCLSVSLS